MKEHVVVSRGAWLCGLAALALSLGSLHADPLLPYSQPIATKLSNDMVTAEARSALRAYHRPSKSLSTDISILRNLNNLLAGNPEYDPLLADAVSGYTADFQARQEAIRVQALPAPLSKPRTNSFGRLDFIRNLLVNTATNEDRGTQLRQLNTVAGRLIPASNMVQRALSAPVGNGGVWANIGRLNFRAVPKGITWSFEGGVFSLAATNSDVIRRVLLLNVEGVGEAPTSLPLATGNNTATYIATDHRKPHPEPFVFGGIPGAETNQSTFYLDAITSRYIVGRFNFTATNPVPTVPGDTNITAVIHNGHFQLNLPEPGPAL